MRRLLVALTMALTLAPALFAQGPSASWRTIQLPHFRVHYPVEYEAWAMRAAERLESTREVVSAEVGFTPQQTIDVIVMNPVAAPNGLAWPLLDTPRMIFYAEPPGPDEQLGAFGHWIDLLSVHETAHLVHMLRPSRNPMERAVEKFVIPLNPITLRAPRWVLEGYATVVEGRITGAGRPTSTIRALILRRWAENGRLPGYGQLDSDNRFLGMSMAYLMGSAYLEWLEQRAGPGSLRKLWARMTARHRRTFNEAFIGVFGERPDRLYGQFVAELTAASVLRDAEVREGALFQETSRASGDPAVSPDGSQIAVVLRPREQPEKLVVWSTAAATEEEGKYQERLQKILERDPDDVAPVRTKPLPRKAVHSLTMPDGGGIHTPRWTRDGKALVFAHRVPDGEGILHYDLYRWDFKELTRITRLADVRDADPIDDRTAVAVRSRYGASQLVTVDLASGEVTPRGEASIDHVVSHPRVSPDGRRIAQVAHRGGRWTLFVDDAAVELPGDPASPEWISNDELVVTVLSAGYAELFRVGAGPPVPLTRTSGGAFDPAPAKDGRVFFMSLDPDGYVLRVLETTEPAGSEPRPDFIPSSRQAPRALESQALQPPRNYGAGKQEFAWLSGGNFAPDHESVEVGARLGDVVGRFDTLLIASFGDLEGVALTSAWRGWPVELRAHLFRSEERSIDDSGGELRAVWNRRFPRSKLTLEGGASDEIAFAGASFTTRQVRGETRFEEVVRVDADDEHVRAVIGAGLSTGSLRLSARYQHDEGAPVTLGGIPSSILPRSSYALRVLDPALPTALLAGDEYDGWRIEATLSSLPFTFFYQRHEIGSTELSLLGAEATLSSDPFPVLKAPGLDLTLGVARVFDAPLEGETNWWVGMRWRP